MVVIRTQFDGKQILLPEDLRGLPPQEVIVIYNSRENALESEAWLKAQEATFDKAWDNEEDAIYDEL